MTTPIRDLGALLAGLQPVAQPGTWAWCALAEGALPAGVTPAATLREPEGLTVVVPEDVALRHGWPVVFRSAWLTLRVHSDLEAVGLTAAVAAALTEAGIACNVIAGVHHDHLFVPVGRAQDALQALGALQAAARA